MKQTLLRKFVKKKTYSPILEGAIISEKDIYLHTIIRT